MIIIFRFFKKKILVEFPKKIYFLNSLPKNLPYLSFYQRKIISFAILLLILSNALFGQSVFNLPYGDILLELNQNIKICIVKKNNLLDYIYLTQRKCEFLNLEFFEVIELLGKTSKSKEIIYGIFNEKNEVLNPQFQINKNSFTLLSIVYNRKENLYKLELLDSDANYYYLIKDIKSIKVKN
jgi:hypothetical protein